MKCKTCKKIVVYVNKAIEKADDCLKCEDDKRLKLYNLMFVKGGIKKFKKGKN